MRIVLVEPKYEINLGLICRVAKNFGHTEIFLVNPTVKPKFTALKFSKHAVDVLKSIKIVDSLDKALLGCDISIGTTGIIKRYKQTYKIPIPLSRLKQKLSKAKYKKIALIFGSEGTGLKQKDLDRCDIISHIETDDAYPVLNLSHSVAIFLYELSHVPKKQTYTPASASQLKATEDLFSFFVNTFKSRFRNPEKINIAFKRILTRAMPQKSEITCLLNVFRNIKLILEKNKIK